MRPVSPSSRDPFPTTQWTELFALRELGGEGRRLALAHLYERYWTPLYDYLRRRGLDPDESGDLLQGFFTHLLEREFVDNVRLSGRLRAFLLAALKNYLRDDRAHRNAAKRRPDTPVLSLDVETAEGHYLELPSDGATPEEVYEQRWARAMFERARRRLEETEARAGRGDDFERLRAHVFGEGDGIPYRRIAEVSGVSESAIKVRIHRLRKRFGQFLREDIELTVTDSRSVDDELRHLVATMGPAAVNEERPSSRRPR